MLRDAFIYTLAVGFIFVGLVNPAVAGSARDYISIVGSSTVYPFATVVAEQFGKTTSYKTPKIESTGSGGGLKLFCAGIGDQYPDIANASRRIKASEVARCAGNGVDDIVEVKLTAEGGLYTEEQIQHERERLGLADPLPIQFVRYMAGLAQGDLGISLWTGSFSRPSATPAPQASQTSKASGPSSKWSYMPASSGCRARAASIRPQASSHTANRSSIERNASDAKPKPPSPAASASPESQVDSLRAGAAVATPRR